METFPIEDFQYEHRLRAKQGDQFIAQSMAEFRDAMLASLTLEGYGWAWTREDGVQCCFYDPKRQGPNAHHFLLWLPTEAYQRSAVRHKPIEWFWDELQVQADDIKRRRRAMHPTLWERLRCL